MSPIKIDDDAYLIEIAENHGSKLEFDVETWHFLPYWVMKNENGVYLMPLDNLPKHVTDMLQANFKSATGLDSIRLKTNDNY